MINHTVSNSLLTWALSSSKRTKVTSEASIQSHLTAKDEVTLPNLDRDAFYKRLSTFSSAYVNRKRPINALQCAMHGFIDTQYRCGPKQDVCKLTCETCHCNNFVIDITPYQPTSQKGIYPLIVFDERCPNTCTQFMRLSKNTKIAYLVSIVKIVFGDTTAVQVCMRMHV